MEHFCSLFLIVAALACSSATPATLSSNPPAAGSATIDAFCDPLTERVTKASPQHFASLDLGTGGFGPWTEYEDGPSLTAANKQAERFEIGEFWRRDDGAALLRFSASTHTQDESLVVLYCFRPDGSLARSRAVFMSHVLHDGVDGVENSYFDVSGTLISEQFELHDSDTNAPVSASSFPAEPRRYRRLGDLPFAHLLTGPRSN